MSAAEPEPRWNTPAGASARAGSPADGAHLLANIEAALKHRASLLALPPKLEARYADATWRGSNKSVQLWLLWAAAINVLCIGIDAITMPAHILEAMVTRGIVLSGIYLGAAALLKRRRPDWMQGLALVVPTLLLIAAAGYLGNLAGGVHLERYLTAAMFVSFAATIVPNVRFRWIAVQTAFSVLILGGFMLHDAGGSLLRMIVDKVELVTFYPVAIVVALSVRARLERIHRRNLLMAWRDEMRLADLARSNARHHAVLSAMTQGVLLREPDGLISLVNQRAVTLLGFPERALKGEMYASELLRHQAQQGEFSAGIAGMTTDDMAAAFKGDSSRLPVNYERQRPDGSIIEVRGVPLPDGGMVRTYTDVTESRDNEAALAKARDIAEIALANMAQGIIMRQSNDLITVINRRAIELLGLPERFLHETITGKDILQYQLEQREFDGHDTPEALRKTIYDETGDLWPLNYERRRADGTYLEIRSTMLPDGGFVRTYTDITERKQNEAALAKARDIAEAALANMTQGIIMRQSNGLITVINRRAIELLGLPERFMHEEVWSTDIIRHQRESGEFDDASVPAGVANAVFNTDETAIPDFYERRRPNGTVLEIRSTPLPGGGVVRTYTDITDRKNNEIALAKARDAAEAASRARSEFLAMMSHEIRTPMNAVLGFTGSLLETRLDEDQRRSAEAIEEASDGLLKILNDILDLSKLDAGRLEFETLPFAPDSVIDSVKSMFATRAADKGLSLVADVDPDLPKALLGDSARLRQVLLNLVGNAVKFTSDGEVVILAQCVTRDAERATIRIAVRDSGIGIAAERLDGLFTDFVQADPSIHRQFGGTGLGLAISKRLVEQMGGEIAVESTPGTGSTFSFWVSLPVADVSALELLSAANEAMDPREQLALLGRPLRVLIAEDNATNQMVVTRMLKEFDIRVQIAQDGVEALAAATQGGFDVIFMDMRMPKMDGLEATRAIRALGGERGAVPIIALTANAFADDMKACRDAGMNDFVAKPIRKKLLVERLAAIASGALGAGLREARHPPAPVFEATAPADETVLVDRSIAAEICEEIGTEAVAEIVDAFRREGAARIQHLHKLSEAGDRKAMAVEAHTLKGAAGAVGFARLSALARQLEKQVAMMAQSEHAALIVRIGATYDQSCAEIDRRPLTG